MDSGFRSTDRELWRSDGGFYADKVYSTIGNEIGINIGGVVIVKTPAEWHRLASGISSEIKIKPQSWVKLVEGSWVSQPACYQIEYDMQGDHHALITKGFTAMEPIGCNTIGTYETLANAKSAVRRHYAREMMKRVRLSCKETDRG